jgi:hypothetical protein
MGGYRVSPTLGELEVIFRLGHTDHDAVETVMISEARKNPQSESLAVHACGSLDVTNWASDAKMLSHAQRTGDPGPSLQFRHEMGGPASRPADTPHAARSCLTTGRPASIQSFLPSTYTRTSL